MPRMTDSASGPGGPSSLKFAALSVQSYQLDSPPFTGTAIGSADPGPSHSPQSPNGPMSSRTHDQASSRAHDGHTSKDNHRSLRQAGEATPNQSSGKDHPTRALSNDDASRSTRYRTQSRDTDSSRDSDVPDWHLDQRSAAAAADIRPPYSRLSESIDGLEDSTSQVDDEVDGDGPPFLIRRSASHSHKVPVQGQTKVSSSSPVSASLSCSVLNCFHIRNNIDFHGIDFP